MGNRPGYVKASVSQSFNEEEVAVLDRLLALIRRGGDTSVVQRHDGFRSLCAKALTMKKKMREVKKARKDAGLSSKETGEDA